MRQLQVRQVQLFPRQFRERKRRQVVVLRLVALERQRLDQAQRQGQARQQQEALRRQARVRLRQVAHRQEPWLLWAQSQLH